MKIGIVGLGRMGGGLRRRLRDQGHDAVGFDPGAAGSDCSSLAELVAALEPPRPVWLMVPSGDITETAVRDALALLEAGDILVDGGNSYYRDSIRRGAAAAGLGVRYLDVGTSGGIRGVRDGFCLMVGGDAGAFAVLEPVFAALAPPGGYAHVGPQGAGHFAKMVHNGIEYGMMQALGEGFDLLQASGFDFDLATVASLWNRGSVVRSWLLELAAEALARDPGLETLGASVEDSGEGRWTVLEGVERGVDVSVIAQSLFKRFASRDDNAFGLRMLAALRREFGGHAVQVRTDAPRGNPDA